MHYIHPRRIKGAGFQSVPIPILKKGEENKGEKGRGGLTRNPMEKKASICTLQLRPKGLSSPLPGFNYRKSFIYYSFLSIASLQKREGGSRGRSKQEKAPT